MHHDRRRPSPAAHSAPANSPITPYMHAKAVIDRQQRIEQVRKQVMPVPLEMNWSTWVCLLAVAAWSILHMGIAAQRLPSWLGMSTLDLVATAFVAGLALWGSRTSLMPTVAVALMMALSLTFGAAVSPVAMIIVGAACGVVYVAHAIAAAVNPELLAQISKKS